MINAINYLSPIRYYSGNITEYDIKSANINCLIDAGMISIEEYKKLYKLPKQQREIEVGLMIKENPNIYTTISKKISEAKVYLFENNPIEDEQVLRIANDAVYIASDIQMKNLQYGDYIRFIPKSVSNIYLNLMSIIILIKYLDNGNIDIDVKGISNTELHNDFLSEIVSVILILEKSGIKDAINYLSVFIEKYLHYELPVTFYREFNSFSKYRINSNSNYIYNTFDYGIDATEKDKYNLDINYNYSILRELFSVLIEIYNIRIK